MIALPTTSGKESGTGRTAVERYDVEGPVATLMPTTASDVDPELMNRCFVIGVDEDSEQTAAVQARQRIGHTIDQQDAAEQAEQRRRVHHNAQRILQSVRINNPFADQLRFPHARVRDRRDNQSYMTLNHVRSTVRDVVLGPRSLTPINHHQTGH